MDGKETAKRKQVLEGNAFYEIDLLQKGGRPVNTELKNAVKATDKDAQYDTSAKRLLGQKSRLDTVLAAQVRYSQDYHIEEGWGNVIHTYMSKRKLTKEMADAFVDSIIIHGKYDYEIKLVYDDQFADLQKLKKEKEAQTR